MKISLKNLNIKEVERLTREQLKDVLGGNIQTTEGGGACSSDCSGSCTKNGISGTCVSKSSGECECATIS